MKKLALAAALTFAFAGSASAADLAARPYVKAPVAPLAVYNWTGFYVGVNGGWAFDGWDDDKTGNHVAFSAGLAPAVAGGAVAPFLNTKHEGGFGGGQIGYNWQAGQFVFGLETDIQGADIGKTSSVFFPGGGGFVPTLSSGRDHIDWFGTARARAGFAVNQILLYATGGAAYGGVHSSASVVGNPTTTGNFAGSFSDTRFGWVAGAGVEWAFAPNWTVKGEYLHVDLGSDNVVITDPQFPGTTATYHFRHAFDAGRVGINYKFGGPVVAKY